MIDYSIVIPAYNEEAGITSSLTKTINFMSSYSPLYEVIVVDDGSTDGMAGVVERYALEHQEIKLVRNAHKGKGFAVRTGILEASGKYVLMSDADMATPIEELKRLMVWITDHGFDVVIASREGIGAKREGEPLYRHLMGRIFNYLVQIITLPGINDSQCGFKLFKAEAAKDIFERLKIYGADCGEIKGAYVGAFDVEVLYLAKKLGYKIREVPVSWTFVKTARINPIRDSAKMLLDVLKVRVNDLKGVYRI